MTTDSSTIAPEDCPEPGWHETHRYCPCCSWTEAHDWKPRYLVRKADWVGGAPIPDDEPVLVIRAQDEMAVETMQTYIERFLRDTNTSNPVVRDLLVHKQRLVDWQAAHPDKVKRADR